MKTRLHEANTGNGGFCAASSGVCSSLLALTLALAANGAAMPFLLPEDLVDPQGIRLEAQLPQHTNVLIRKDTDRPKLWYAPVAAEAVNNGARLWYQRVNSAEKEYSDQRTLC